MESPKKHSLELLRAVSVGTYPRSNTHTSVCQLTPTDLSFFFARTTFPTGFAYSCRAWGIDAESECHDHRQGVQCPCRTRRANGYTVLLHVVSTLHSYIRLGWRHGSVGAVVPNNSTKSISLIHILAVSDGTTTLPHSSIVMVSRSIVIAL